jgi:hypothetical protein
LLTFQDILVKKELNSMLVSEVFDFLKKNSYI